MAVTYLGGDWTPKPEFASPGFYIDPACFARFVFGERRYLMRAWSESLGHQVQWWASKPDSGVHEYNGTGAPLTDIVIIKTAF